MKWEELTEKLFYDFKIRSRIADDRVFVWSIKGMFGGRGMSAAGKINWCVVLLPHTVVEIFPEERHELISAREIKPTYKEVSS